MGNAGSAGGNGRRSRGSRRSHPPNQPPQPGIAGNGYVVPGFGPYPGQYPNPNPSPNSNLPPGYYHQYQPAGYYPALPPALPMPLPTPHDHHRVPGRCPYGPWPTPYVEHQKAMTIKNEVNLKKDSLRVEKDEENPGKSLISFNFDATAAGSITMYFFAKEGEDCELKPFKENLLPPITIQFEAGLGQKFSQPTGTGIDFTMFEESELLNAVTDIYPLAIKAEACHSQETDASGNTVEGHSNSQITQAVFEKEKGEYLVKVVKQILWVNGIRYELQEIYGIGNSVEDEANANDPGKECVICLSEPRDTTVLPCRHMCMCSGCAKVLRFQTNRCPICRQPVERLLEIKVGKDDTEEGVDGTA